RIRANPKCQSVLPSAPSLCHLVTLPDLPRHGPPVHPRPPGALARPQVGRQSGCAPGPPRSRTETARPMNLNEARRFALSLPQTTEAPHFDKSSFRVEGNIFATVPTDG